MKKLSFILLAGIIAFTSCKKDDEDAEDSPIVGVTITITEDIEEDMIWETGNTYIIDGTIRVTDANITIQKGVVVKFTEDAQLDVAYWANKFATITANGTEEMPIIFTSNSPNPQAGDWDGVFFYKGAINCEFDYCTFQYGGRNDYMGMLSLEDASVSFENCTFKKSASMGINLFDEGKFTSFTNNTLHDNGSYHISILPNFVHTIGMNNAYSSEFGILVSNDGDLDEKGSFTWLNQTAPYFIEGTIRVGAIGQGTNWTIAPGTTLKFMERAQLDLAYWSDKYATVTAIGTVEEPIIFTSASPAPAKGDWDGIFFYEGVANSTFSHCEIKYSGGSEYYGTIHLSECGSPLDLNNTHISDSKSHGISVDEESSVDITNNVTFSNIDGSDYHAW